ncbi:kinase-like domain-containing protein [Chlamydoabsidia padenii]|nr:kinase-like domain-containing protein [Chlamydoabsidia padenii]
MTTPVAEQHPPDNVGNPEQQQQQPTSTSVTNVNDPSHPLHHQRRTVSDFDYGELLGEGSYSTVLMARDKATNKQYAIKKLDKAHIVKNDKVKYVMIERDAISRMNHPGVVKLYWTFTDNRSLYYVLDLAPHGELYTFIKKMAPLDIETTRYYASEILVALEHIHSTDVVHRDVKPENILLDDQMHIKIADFGSAKLLSENTVNQGSGARSFVGTAEFVCPELLRSDPIHKEADWWAFGCVIFQMLSGRSPFKAATDYLIFQKIKNLNYEFPDDFPQVAKDLVQQLLVLDPEQRLGSDARGGVDSIKAHPFFQGTDFDQVFQQPAPEKAQQYMEDLKLQQAQQQSNGSDFDSGDEDGFGVWFDGNGQLQEDLEMVQPSPQQQQQQQQHCRNIPATITTMEIPSTVDTYTSPTNTTTMDISTRQDFESHYLAANLHLDNSNLTEPTFLNTTNSISASDIDTHTHSSSPTNNSSSQLPTVQQASTVDGGDTNNSSPIRSSTQSTQVHASSPFVSW